MEGLWDNKNEYIKILNITDSEYRNKIWDFWHANNEKLIDDKFDVKKIEDMWYFIYTGSNIETARKKYDNYKKIIMT